MSEALNEGQRRYRIWLVDSGNWRPNLWSDAPPESVAMELGEEGALTAEEARDFLRGFNEMVLAHPRGIWAVPVPVIVRYEGDLEPGQFVLPGVIDFDTVARVA